ncbi:hypothetical protein MASR2M70_03450 [Bacillota bacterium]
MKFVGVGSEKVKKYADYISCTNVEFVGKFESDKTVGYLQEADIIYNVYGNKRICERMVLSNKMYYAACLNVPILVCKNTYMYEVAKRCGIGFAVDHCDSSALPDSLFNWFINIDRTASKQNAKLLLKTR